MAEFVSVTSSNIDAIKHDSTTNTLHVRFKGGGVYAYEGVDSDKYAALMNADSVGSYLHAHVKGKHAHSKVD